MGLWLFCIIGDDLYIYIYIYIYIINVGRSLLTCDQAVLLPPFLTPNHSSVLLPVWTVIVRSIPVIKTDKREKKEKEKLLP